MALAATVVNRKEIPATEQDGYQCMQQIPLHDIEVEEQHDQNQRKDRADSDDFHRKVTLCTLTLVSASAFAAHFLGSQPYGTLDDAP